jgi:hypothetical protein
VLPCCWVSRQTERKRDSGAVCPETIKSDKENNYHGLH